MPDRAHDLPHGEPLLRRLGREAARAFRPAHDLANLAESAADVQRPITTGRRIAVVGMRGGSGKSTLSALLALVFANHRHDRVLAVDVDPDWGSLPLRLGVRHRHALADVQAALAGAGSFEDVEPYLTSAGDRLWVLPANRGHMGDSPLTAEIYEHNAVPLTRFFGVTIIDCGSGMRGELQQAVLAGAHAVVLATPATPDGARTAGRALDLVAASGLGHLIARTVVVFTVKSPHTRKTLDLDGAAAILADVGAGAVRLDYDRHLASTSTLDPRRLAHSTRTTAIRIAAETLQRALHPTSL
ncbi:MinD/ParA family protein [Actinomadura miaoliensis]|uniref:CobQ/CobB/MinD/ParA nucleotide binding domain-containing protein n=1 Tax=Actinomadura miaoliensis TaxID=430685 RepID=A0ABP7V4S7_9ACTN